MPAQRKLSAITLDRPDPPALAAFYQRATGLEPHPGCDADFAGLNDGDGLLPVSSGSTTTGLPTGRTGSFLGSSTSTSTSTSTTSTRPRHGCSNSVRAGRRTTPAQSPAGPPRPRRAPLVSGGQGLTALAHEGEARGEGIVVDKTLPFVAAGRAAHSPLARSAPLGGVSVSAVRLCVRADHAGRAPVPRPIASSSPQPRSPAAPQPRSPAAPQSRSAAVPQPRSPAALQVRGRAGRVTGAVFGPHTGMVMGCQVTAKPMEMALAMT